MSLCRYTPRSLGNAFIHVALKISKISVLSYETIFHIVVKNTVASVVSDETIFYKVLSISVVSAETIFT